MRQLSISMAHVYVLFSKSVGDGVARRDGHNDLVGTVGDFSIHLYIIYVPPPLKKYKECSCALPSINIPKNIWCGLILKDDQNQEVTRSFCQVKLFLKTHGAYTLQENRAPIPAPSNNFIMCYQKMSQIHLIFNII